MQPVSGAFALKSPYGLLRPRGKRLTAAPPYSRLLIRLPRRRGRASASADPPKTNRLPLVPPCNRQHLFSSLLSDRVSRFTSAARLRGTGRGCSSPDRPVFHPLVPRTDSSFVIFALKRIIKYLVDSCRGIVRMAVIADINRDRNAAMNATLVAPLPKSDISLLSDDVTFPT